MSYLKGNLIALVGVALLAGCASSPERAPDTRPLLSPPTESFATDELTGEGFFRIVLAELALRNSEPELALELYDAALTMYPNNIDILARVAPLSIQLGQIEAAAYYYERWTVLTPNHLEAWHGLWQLSLGLDQVTTAVNALGELLVRQPDYALYVPYELLRTWPVEQQRQLRTELAGAELPADRSPDLILLNGFLAEELGDERAADILWRALDSQLRSPQDYQAYGQTLIELSLWRGADILLTSASRSHPEVDRFYLSRAQAQLSQNDQAGALAILKEGLDALPNNPRLLRFGGELAYVQEDSAARDYFEQLLDTELASIGYYYLGRLSEDDAEYNTAFEYYLQVGDPDWAPSAIQRQLRLIAADLIPSVDVQDLFEQHRMHFANIQHQIAELHGRFWYDVGQYERAYDAYTQGLNEQPTDITLLYLRALSAEPIDRLDSLETDLRKILELDPDNAAALNALGYTLADRTDRLEEARPLIERAYELNPNSAAIVDSLGWLYFREGNYSRAATVLRQALDMQGWDADDDEIVAHYVEALWRNGDTEMALSVAAEWQAQHSNTDRLQRILDQINEAP
ncbi:tetratricopeptide repeat protein [Salinispirillum sp. LH 10-3-1]|uniref:Tetratricopeptide repeat protein n=1 Tax=Salinispirillum sp. LH 10-3-1 TaxID=2952525 RepID=A0AB38YCM6_9GAMM